MEKNAANHTNLRALSQPLTFGVTTLRTTDEYMSRKRHHSTITVVAVNDILIPRLVSAASAAAEAIRATGPGKSRVVPVGQPHRRLARPRNAIRRCTFGSMSGLAASTGVRVSWRGRIQSVQTCFPPGLKHGKMI